MYGLTKGLGGTHNVVQSWEIRTAISASGKNKGKRLGFGKYQGIVSEVANNIFPIYKKQLDLTGLIPSGQQEPDVLEATKLTYYDTRVSIM
jgi:hypothetical protein